MTPRETWKACQRANRKWRRFETCHGCGNRCAEHHAIRPVRGYSFKAVEWECACGALNLFDDTERIARVIADEEAQSGVSMFGIGYQWSTLPQSPFEVKS